MPKFNQCVSLKIDFKFDETTGALEIIDVGSGLSSGAQGFDETLRPRMLQDLHQMTGAAVAPIFGELLQDTTYPESASVPIARRALKPGESPFMADDLVRQGYTRLIPMSEVQHMEDYLGHVWKTLYPKITAATPPIAFASLAGYKILWNCLVDRYRKGSAMQKRLYWHNHESPKMKDSALNMLGSKQGYFIKIVNSSNGRADDIFYAKDSEALADIMTRLHIKYLAKATKGAPEYSCKKIYAIEPAYVSLVKKKEHTYNATGRAFFTLGYSSVSDTLEVRVAGAKWILPKSALSQKATSSSMLANVANSEDTITLNPKDAARLHAELTKSYGDVFKACFKHDDLFEHFKDVPVVNKWLGWFPRSGSIYPMHIDFIKRAKPKEFIKSLESQFRDQLINQHHSNSMQHLQFISSGLVDVSAIIHQSYRQMPAENIFSIISSYHCVLKNHVVFSSSERCNAFIVDLTKLYLKKMSANYDTKDLNRALRQAAYTGDLRTLQLFIQTNQADVNAVSPKSKQTALDFADKSKAPGKASCIAALELAGAVSSATKRTELAARNRFFSMRVTEGKQQAHREHKASNSLGS